MSKFHILYLDKYKNKRHHFINAADSRDALVNAWLANKDIADILSVECMQVTEAAWK